MGRAVSYAVCPHCAGEGGYTDAEGHLTPACAVCHGSGALPWFSRHLEPEPPLKTSLSAPAQEGRSQPKGVSLLSPPGAGAGVDGGDLTDSHHTED